MTRRKKWRDLSGAQQRVLTAGSVLQFTLLGAALLDLRRRTAEELNGPKPLWIALSFVNFVGPIAYFVIGRKRRTE